MKQLPGMPITTIINSTKFGIFDNELFTIKKINEASITVADEEGEERVIDVSTTSMFSKRCFTLHVR